MKREIQIQIANAIKAGDRDKVCALIRAHFISGTWKKFGDKFVAWLEHGGSGQRPFTVFIKGNSKLPFYAFSALPLVTCPGMGACAQWCYSLKAWRFPAAFLRQCMNTWMVLHDRVSLCSEFAWLCEKQKGEFDLRLYVDGDFDSVTTIDFWMKLLHKYKNVRAYGYSKSWQHLVEYRAQGYEYPSNYVLNLSGGSRFDNDPAMKAAVSSLSCVRGEFVALPAETSPKDFKKHRDELLSKMTGKRFVCPGKCGVCVLIGGKNVHACGSKLFTGVKIAIGLH